MADVGLGVTYKLGDYAYVDAEVLPHIQSYLHVYSKSELPLSNFTNNSYFNLESCFADNSVTRSKQIHGLLR